MPQEFVFVLPLLPLLMLLLPLTEFKRAQGVDVDFFVWCDDTRREYRDVFVFCQRRIINLTVAIGGESLLQIMLAFLIFFGLSRAMENPRHRPFHIK